MNALSSMKASSTPAAKLYNWNCLSKELGKAGVPLDQDTKSLIVAGDLELIADLLYQLDEVAKKNGAPISRRGSQASLRSEQSKRRGGA